MSNLPIEQIEENFADLYPAMTDSEAAIEANRCLFCFDAPCMHACPTHIDIPGFIKKIANENLTGSARVIFDANPVGATCARVCPVEVLCEGACVEKTLVNKPIEIGRLQRYATDHALSNGIRIFKEGESKGRTIGIIGAGPAGLSCATYLARLGYSVTIYDRREKPGGLDTYGMAEYKMTQAVSLAEIEPVADLGVEFRQNVEIGRDIQFGELETAHDALFLAVGLGATNKLNIPGEDLDGVIDALDLIDQIKTRDWKGITIGDSVIVLGAGNTAIDAATQSKRLGAKRVRLVYRRTEKEAPAYDYEMELAHKDEVEFVWQTTPLAILGDESVRGIRVLDAAGSERDIECDMVIKAIGQTKLVNFFTEIAGVKTDESGRPVVNASMQTSKPGIFAGGDCVNGGGEAVEAAQMGKLAAIGIHETITGEKVEFAGAFLREPPKAPVDPNPH
ncbi:MAG: NAD(P)-dependent oxidoreductase [Acidobacteria bacterium]|nr:NAD(P)-dependent oxidoreductase [Acidobacteriota bacterium]